MDNPLRRQLRSFSDYGQTSYRKRVGFADGKSVRFDIDENDFFVRDRRRRRNRLLHYLETKLAHSKHVIFDWLFLAILGISGATVSILIDQITKRASGLLQYLIASQHQQSPSYFNAPWIVFTTTLILAAALFVRLISMPAIGSGTAEMKTMIRGVILKDYLTIRTLIAKIGGLTLCLSSGLPMGKAGPMVHISSILADQYSRLFARFEPSFLSESRRLESLAAAGAVGVASTFAAPVGGVLYSIEVTTMYFTVRNYWRGFFASCCGAIAVRMMRQWATKTEVTVKAYYQTKFNKNAFVVDELPCFIFLGVVCGLLGVFYIHTYKKLVLFLRTNHYAKIFQRHWYIYPLLVASLFSMLSFPHGIGRFFAGRVRLTWNLNDFFSDCSFKFPTDACRDDILDRWLREPSDVLLRIFFFIVSMFFSTIICQTLPVPSGVFGPTFVIGAAVGRLQGELMLLLFRNDSTEGLHVHPGVYAVVGSAAFSAAVTHSVSVSVMIFEMTGQLWLIIPTMIGTIVARAVSANFTISWIDNIIKLKHLPFLPDIPPNNDRVHTTVAEEIMVSPAVSLPRYTNYQSIRKILLERMDLNVFPIVESKETEMLIGTVTRGYLLHVLEEQVGAASRKSEAERRVRKAIETIDQHFTNGPTEQQNERSTGQVRRIFSDPRLRVSLSSSAINPQHSIKRITKTPEPRRIAVQHVFQVTPVRMPDYLQRSAVDPEVANPARRGSSQRRNALFNVRETITEDEEEEEEEEEDSLTRPSSSPREEVSTGSSEGQSLNSGGGGDYQKVVNAYKKHAKLLKKVVNKVTGNWIEEEDDDSAYDLTPNEREDWEKERLQLDFHIPDAEIDAAPSQLVRKTPLIKIHSIFSMLQINRAYVVDCGRLVGVVALADVRDALEHSLSDDPEKFNRNILPLSRKASVRSSVPSEKISDSLMPTLEVVGKAATMEADEAFVKREKDAIRRMTSLKSSQREDMHQLSIHKSPGASSEAEQLVEAVAYLRKISMSSGE